MNESLRSHAAATGEAMQDDDHGTSARETIEAELAHEVSLLLNAIRDADYVSPPIEKQARDVRECLVRNALCNPGDPDTQDRTR